jgi:hypothetical protein
VLFIPVSFLFFQIHLFTCQVRKYLLSLMAQVVLPVYSLWLSKETWTQYNNHLIVGRNYTIENKYLLMNLIDCVMYKRSCIRILGDSQRKNWDCLKTVIIWIMLITSIEELIRSIWETLKVDRKGCLGLINKWKMNFDFVFRYVLNLIYIQIYVDQNLSKNSSFFFILF